MEHEKEDQQYPECEHCGQRHPPMPNREEISKAMKEATAGLNKEEAWLASLLAQMKAIDELMRSGAELSHEMREAVSDATSRTIADLFKALADANGLDVNRIIEAAKRVDQIADDGAEQAVAIALKGRGGLH